MPLEGGLPVAYVPLVAPVDATVPGTKSECACTNECILMQEFEECDCMDRLHARLREG